MLCIYIPGIKGKQASRFVKENCSAPSRQIPEEEIYRLATEVLKLDEFDEDILHSKIKNIRAKITAHYYFTLRMEQKFQRTGFHAQERIAGLLKCENVQGKEHLIKRE